MNNQQGSVKVSILFTNGKTSPEILLIILSPFSLTPITISPPAVISLLTDCIECSIQEEV